MPGQIVDAALEGHFISITSDALIDELSRVLRYEQLRAKFPEPECSRLRPKARWITS